MEKIMGKSPKLQQVLELCEMVSKETVTVLLRGETGVGKELLARTIHRMGPRQSGPFVVMNCPAITSTIAESELFGHAKGAFTGAVNAGEGILAAADKGTLFMDEVGDLDMIVQLKLLRFLNGGDETGREVRRVGSAKTARVDVRIIAATNQKLIDLVQSGKFREDLYHRLNPFVIHIPALRNRISDLPALVEHFLGGFKIDESALDRLRKYSWPGNIRELENVLRTAKMLARHHEREKISTEDIRFTSESEEEDEEPSFGLASA